jgi:arsenate reductase
MKELNVADHGFTLQDIKTDPITAEQLDEITSMWQSQYDAPTPLASLFSKKARMYRSRGLHEMSLHEEDYRKLLLEEYTFLKRPVFVIGNQVFAGNAKTVIGQVADLLR